VVRKVLSEAARSGLPGEHHFNIAFKTQAPGVVIPAAMRQRYPDEMAIILQHEFWDLEVTPDAIEVSLNFSRRPERLTIPFDAITGFSDPSVPFGFKLEPRVAAEAAPAKPTPLGREAGQDGGATPVAGDASKPSKPATAPKSAEAPSKKQDKPSEGEVAKVVSIDAFRKK
jgi:hypothetical protein